MCLEDSIPARQNGYFGIMSPDVSVLHLREAIDLAHGLVQHVAAGRGIRILFIKGPSLERHGLRPARVSADVDVLVEPARFAEFCEALEDCGWGERPGIEALTVLHSRTFYAPQWPCDLDPHSSFPGFLAPPESTFEILWSRRDTMDFAHRSCDVADRTGSILVMALHSLRGSSRQARHQSEFEHLSSLSMTNHEREDLLELARATGAEATAKPLLDRLGIGTEIHEATLQSEEYREWVRRAETHTHGAYPWLIAFKVGDARQRLRIMWHVIWPPTAELRRSRPEIGAGRWAEMRGRLGRWRRGLVALPGGLRLLREQNHGS